MTDRQRQYEEWLAQNNMGIDFETSSAFRAGWHAALSSVRVQSASNNGGPTTNAENNKGAGYGD
jgi:uridine phosphorylase